MNCELIFYVGSSLLEGPVWNKNTNTLLCVSIEQERIYLIDLDIHVVDTVSCNGQVGFAVFEDDSTIIYAAYNGVFRVDLNSKKQEFLFHAIDEKNIRYNDGCYDPAGRLILGTTGYKCFAEGKNRLISFDGTNIQTLIDGTSISNGIGFYKEYMFFIDTPSKKIDKYIYDIDSGKVIYDGTFARIEGRGVPDGMCIDDNGNVYVAIWGGARIDKFNSSGEKVGEFEMPVLNVSSCCIVGSKIFVTTAKHDDGTESEAMAGGLFSIDKF